MANPLDELEKKLTDTPEAASGGVKPDAGFPNPSGADLNAAFQEDSLQTLIRLQEESSFRTLLCAILLTLLLAAAGFSIYVNIRSSNQLGLAAEAISEFLDDVDTDALNDAVVSLKDTADALNEGIDTDTLSAAVSALKSTADILGKLDVESLNTAFTDLQSAAASFEDSFDTLDIDAFNETVTKLNGAAGTLSDVDTESLNELVSSLNTVAESLENTSDRLSSLFGGGLFNKDKDKDKDDGSSFWDGLFNKDKGNG